VDSVPALGSTPGAFVAGAAGHQDDPEFLGRLTALSTLADLRFAGDSVVAIDNENGRVLILDSVLNSRGVIGRQGAGPGELENPQELSLWNGMYVVSDAVSQRVTFFRPNGGYAHSVRAPQGTTSFDLDARGTLYLVSCDRTHYLDAIPGLGKGARRRMAARPLDLYGRDDLLKGVPRGLCAELVVVTRGGEIHVFDNQLGLLTKFDSTGRVLVRRRLPDEHLRNLRQRRREIWKDLRRPDATVPLVKDMTLTPDGQIFLLFNSGTVFGLVVDPSSYTAIPLHLPSAATDAKPIVTARAAVLGGNAVHLVNEMGYSAHPLRRSGP
jgi:hypothetical protein